MAKINHRPLLLTLTYLCFIFLISCAEGDKIVPESTGQSGGLLIVLSDQVYKSTLPDSLLSILNTEVDALPQFEPQFDVIIIKESEFSHLFQMHRNILTVHVDENLGAEGTELAIKKNIWSRPQVVARLRSSDTTSLKQIIRSYSVPLLEAFNTAERERIMVDYATIKQKEITDKLQQDFNFNMSVPKTFKPAKNDSNFLWVRREEREYEQGIMIYQRNYTDQNEFRQEDIIAYRDSITRTYIPGPSEGSFMVSEKRLPVFSDTISIADNFGIMTRGLWRTEGDFMGGPFVNYTFYNEINKQLISIDGYVYAPKYDKREKVRQLEAIIYSLSK